MMEPRTQSQESAAPATRRAADGSPGDCGAGGRGGTGGATGGGPLRGLTPSDVQREVPREQERRPERASVESAHAVAALWLALWQRVAGRSAHEVKNALNGVSVNLEVVRSRLARSAADPGAAPSLASATRFAEVASAQFELLTVLTEALLGLARPPRAPADVVQLLAPLTVLLDAVARSEGGSLIVGGLAPGAPSTVAAPPAVTRLVLAAALDAAVGRGRAVTCRVESGRDVRVRVAWDGAVPAAPLAPEVVAVATEAGIGVEAGSHAVTLTFAPAATGAAPVAAPLAEGTDTTPDSQ